MDGQFMKAALAQAKIGRKAGNYPVGAVLVADGKIIAKACNRVQQTDRWIAHGELLAIHENSAKIKRSVRSGKPVTLYTTLEPCLMCLGAAVLHRVSRIVYACPDPHGGATKTDPKTISSWYVRKWPRFEQGPYRAESYALVTEFMKEHPENWAEILKVYEKMGPGKKSVSRRNTY